MHHHSAPPTRAPRRLQQASSPRTRRAVPVVAQGAAVVDSGAPAGGAAGRWVTGIAWAPVSTLRSGPAAGTGLATVTSDGTVLDTWYPAPRPRRRRTGRPRAGEAGRRGRRPRGAHHGGADAVGSLAAPPADASDVYLRLHLLSHRLVRPHEINLDGVFGLLSNVVWTNLGPCAVAGFESVRPRLRSAGRCTVYGVDKFPRMVDYVLPTGVRIADADRVRLGAHLAAGTTVMHEGFVNYNAGTLGSSMVEGRISAGVVSATAPTSAAVRR